MAGVVNMITGNNPDAKKAAARQAVLQKQQEATQARVQIREDTRETDLSAQDAAMRRAVAARRRGSGSLAFTGATTSLKSTMGG